MKKFLLIAYLVTWACWLGAYWLSQKYGVELLTNQGLLTVLTDTHGKTLLLNLLFSIGVYGPIIGFFITSNKKLTVKDFIPGNSKYWKLMLCALIVINIPVAILSYLNKLTNITNLTIYSFLTAIGTYAFSNFITSGTEEFGWRGYLYNELKKTEKDFWSAAWKGGLLWAIWHFPLLFIMYAGLSTAAFIPTLIGFTASIIGMSYVTNWFYEKTHSLLFIMVLHALNNTFTFTLTLLFPNTPFMILANLLVWAVVGYLEKDPINFITKPDANRSTPNNS